MPDDEMQMNEGEFVRAQFFCSAEEMAALKAATEQKRAETKARRDERAAKRREFTVMQTLVSWLDTQPMNVRRAYINWLADRFLKAPQAPETSAAVRVEE
jgi:hypothetical protein